MTACRGVRRHLATLLGAGLVCLSLGCAQAPGWWRNPPKKTGTYYGTAQARSSDAQLAIVKAQADARGELAQQLSTYYGGLIRRFREEMGANSSAETLDGLTLASKQVTSETLIGSRPVKQKVVNEKGRYLAFVLIELPVGDANQAFLYQIKKNQALYAQVGPTAAFRDLDRQTAAAEGKPSP